MTIVQFTETNNHLTLKLPGGTASLDYASKGGVAQIRIKLPYKAAYGMGEKYDSVNQIGKCVCNQVEEKFCHQGNKTYCSAPFFFTDSGFGLYVCTGCTTEFDFGETIVVSLPPDAKVNLFSAVPPQIICEYMSLFGKPKLPPKWAFGPWISANHWSSFEMAELQIQNLKKYGFPATVIVLEAWSDEATFYIFNKAKYRPVPGNAVLHYNDFDFSNSPWKDPKILVEDLHQNGLHLILWQIPVYKKQAKNEPLNSQNENDKVYAQRHSLCVLRSDGSPYTIPEGKWFAGSCIPDFTNPETKKLWFDKRQYLLDIGVDGFKTDGGEFIYTDDVRFSDGSDGRQMKNRYAQEYAAAYSNFVGNDRIVFSRAGSSGQHTDAILWAGDQQSENCELRSVLNAGLSAAMSGIPFWGFDIAGFAGKLPSPDLYRRATQLACFCPIMQWHSEPDGGQFRTILSTSDANNERSPWNIAHVNHSPEFLDEMRFWHNLRMNLLPYLYSTAIDCAKSNRPMIRPLAYDFYDDETAIQTEDEFLLGDSLLVAPLLEENASHRNVYFPCGDWVELFTKKHYQGNAVAEINCGKRLPVFLRSSHGIALNLGSSKSMGSPVGNAMEGYAHFCILAAGQSGCYSFCDDLGNDFTLTWKEKQYSTTGSVKMELDVLFI